MLLEVVYIIVSNLLIFYYFKAIKIQLISHKMYSKSNYNVTYNTYNILRGLGYTFVIFVCFFMSYQRDRNSNSTNFMDPDPGQ